MNHLPRLELTENPDKKSDFIIFRKSMNKKTKKNVSKKRSRKRSRKTGFFKLF